MIPLGGFQCILIDFENGKSIVADSLCGQNFNTGVYLKYIGIYGFANLSSHLA
jgi:hypothetical protein